MSADRPLVAGDLVPDDQKSRSRYAILLVGVVLLLSVAAVVVIQPRVGRWLEVQSACRDLSSEDYDTRIDAIRRLRNVGENAERELIALLQHPDEGVRYFAADQLANGPRVTDEIVEAFLVALESDRHVAEIGGPGHAPNLFFKHGEGAVGPLTETDLRIVAWLRRELNSTNPEQSGSAAWALAAFVTRDSSLRQPLATYLTNGVFFYKYLVLRELVDSDPSLRDQYIDVLLSGLASASRSDQANAQYGLTHLKTEPDNLRSRLEVRREGSTDPGEISWIDQALELIQASPPPTD